MLHWHGTDGQRRSMATQAVWAAAGRLAEVLDERQRVALHLPATIEWALTYLAVRIAGLKAVGLLHDPGVVVTADGMLDGRGLRPLKEEVDGVAPDCPSVIVVRHLGDVPLDATMDAYLDPSMRPGRDVWFSALCPYDWVVEACPDVPAVTDPEALFAHMLAGHGCLLRERAITPPYVGASG